MNTILHDVADRWLVPLRRSLSPTARLICFPYGGGGPSAFQSWSTWIPLDFDLWSVCLPGRDVRASAPYVENAERVVQYLQAELAALASVRNIFYGHSLGAALALQLTERLRVLGTALPDKLILSGRLPPHIPYDFDIKSASEYEFLQRLVLLGGMSSSFLVSPQMRTALVPRILSDFRLNDDVIYHRLQPFDIPITVINGTEDPTVDPSRIEQWRDYTKKDFRNIRVAGGHFFPQQNTHEFSKILMSEILVYHE